MEGPPKCTILRLKFPGVAPPPKQEGASPLPNLPPSVLPALHKVLFTGQIPYLLRENQDLLKAFTTWTTLDKHFSQNFWCHPLHDFAWIMKFSSSFYSQKLILTIKAISFIVFECRVNSLWINFGMINRYTALIASSGNCHQHNYYPGNMYVMAVWIAHLVMMRSIFLLGGIVVYADVQRFPISMWYCLNIF